MLKQLRTQGLTEGRNRAIVEQFVSNDPNIYSVEDDKFLYYAENVKETDKTVKIFHIVKGKVDYCMEIDEWELFVHLMLNVSDEYFITGEGKEFKDCFLGNYLSKYNRRKEFINDLAYVIDDAKEWLH